MNWVGSIARIFPKRFVPYYSLILVFTSVSDCAQTYHKQYQYYDCGELSKAIGVTYFGGPRTISDGTHVAVHGTVPRGQIKEVLKSMQDPEYREKSKGMMVFSLYPLSGMGGSIKLTTRDIGIVEALGKQCDGAKETWSCLILVYGTVTSFQVDAVHTVSIEIDKIEHRKASKVSFFLAMRSGIGRGESQPLNRGVAAPHLTSY